MTPERTAPTERVVDLRPRTVLRVLLIVIAVAVTLEVIWIARHIIAWVVISLFLALALNPLVGWIQRRTRLARGPAIGDRLPDRDDRDRRGRRDLPAEADRRGQRLRAGDCRTTSTT